MKKTLVYLALSFITLLSACTTNQETTESAPAMSSGDMPMRELNYADYAEAVNKGEIEKDTLKTSARREATGQVGDLQVKINYGSPGVRGRSVWNGLVGYDQVWVTGAHTATKVEFSKDVRIGDVVVKAGAYGFFTIPSEGEWILLLNRNYDQHLADDYTESEDVVRVTVKPSEHPMTQRLTYAVETTSDSEGAIAVTWEKIKVTMPFSVN